MAPRRESEITKPGVKLLRLLHQALKEAASSMHRAEQLFDQLSGSEDSLLPLCTEEASMQTERPCLCAMEGRTQTERRPLRTKEAGMQTERRPLRTWEMQTEGPALRTTGTQTESAGKQPKEDPPAKAERACARVENVDATAPDAAGTHVRTAIAFEAADAMQPAGSSIGPGSELVARRASVSVFHMSMPGTKWQTKICALREGESVVASQYAYEHDGRTMVPIRLGARQGVVYQDDVMLAPCARAWPLQSLPTQKCRGWSLRPRALLLGDSITELGNIAPWDGNLVGWVGRLEQHYSRRVDILNRGLSSYNTRQALAVLPRILDDSMLQEPLLFAVVMLGTNDACSDGQQHVGLSQYKENLAQILELLQKQGCQHIILLSPPPVHPLSDSRSNGLLEQYVTAAQYVARGGRQVRFVNVFQAMKHSKDFFNVLLQPDGVHLTANGQLELFNLLLPELPEPPHCDLPDCDDVNNLPGRTVGEVRARYGWHVNLRGTDAATCCEPPEPARTSSRAGRDPWLADRRGAAGAALPPPPGSSTTSRGVLGTGSFA